MNTIKSVVDFLLSTPFLENTALVTGILYLIFLIKEKIVAWIFAFISTIILTYLFFSQKVYMQTLLNLYYAIIAVFAFIKWFQKEESRKPVIKISEYRLRTHLILILGTSLLSGILIFFLIRVAESSYPVLDGFIFGFSMLATYLQVYKIVSSWLYWIIINCVTILLLISLKLYSVVLLMLVYMILAILGYWQWKKELKRQK